MTQRLVFSALLSFSVCAVVGCGSAADPATADSGGTPIEGLTNDTWNFVTIPGAQCRDGSATGIAVNPSSTSANVMIYLEGGGACFNTVTCADNPSSFDSGDFNPGDLAGVLSRTDAQNAFKDWTLVFVPYCTGDVHSGDAADTVVADLLPDQPRKQQFVGYANMGVYLDRLVPTFPTTTHVVLVGESAGGFGAVANYQQTARAFGNIPVDLVDDSGPTMRAPQAETCLQQKWSSLWSWQDTVIADCGADCSGDDLLLDALKHIGKSFPDRRIGLVESTGDAVIAAFFGFGADACGSFSPIEPGEFSAGLADIRSAMAFDENFGAFVFNGFDHTSLSGFLDTRSTNGVKLSDWVTAIANGSVTNVGP